MVDKIDTPNRILLGQLISNGDCLYATAVAQQIKHDFPGCHLTWAVSSLCRRMIEENPWVDAIWEIPLANWSNELLRTSWHSFAAEALILYERGVYDFVFFTQIYPGNPHHFEGTVRPGIFLGYPGRMTVPLQPSVSLRTEEVEKVKIFAQKNRLQDFQRVILFESASKSGQSHITPAFALQTAEKIVKRSAGRHAVILSSHHAVQSSVEGIIDGSVLTLRELAELTKYCSLLIGCSSGISCISTSKWAKPLPMIQMLTNRCAMFASLAHDYLYFGLPTSHVIEIFDGDVERLVGCVSTFFEQGWEKAKALYHQDPRIVFSYYLDFTKSILLNVLDYYGFCISLRHVVDRYGWHSDLQAALRNEARKILGQAAVDRELSSDQLLRKVTRPAHALSSASSGIWGYDAPSLRPETCVLSLRRNKPQLEQLLEATYGLAKDNPVGSELIAALTDGAPKEKVLSLQARHSKEPWHRLAAVLACMQQAEYADARRVLLEWKQTAPSWKPQLEEILGDLTWMEGCHSKALANYQTALEGRSENPHLQKKIERLLSRNRDTPKATKPETALRDLGLAFYAVEPIDKITLDVVTRIRPQIAALFSLDTAYFTAPGNDSGICSLIAAEDLPKTGLVSCFNHSKFSLDCKEFIGASVDWAERTGKTWIALAPLGSVITISFLRELHHRLARQPSALIVDRWSVFVSADGTTLNISEQPQSNPALILMRVDWWKKNNEKFRAYPLTGADWMAYYAARIRRLTKAAYLPDAEHRLLTIQQEAPLAGSIRRVNRLVDVLKRELSAAIRLIRLPANHPRGKP